MAKRTYDMVMPSPGPDQVTNDTKEISLQDQVDSAVRLKNWTQLVQVLKKCKSSGIKENFQNKWCVEAFFSYILPKRRLNISFLLEEISKQNMLQFIATDGKKCNILCHAVKGQRVDWVDYLLQIGADVNQHCEFHQSPLIQACEGGNKDLVLKLIQRGADPNFQNAHPRADKYGNTPLGLIVQRGQVDLLDLLLKVQPMSREDRINAMEVCAAFRAPEDMDRVFEFLQRAMKERHDDPFDILHKPDQVPDPDLGYVLESRSPQELSDRKNNSAALMMECLAIRKRNPNFGGGTRVCSRDLSIYEWLLVQDHKKEMCFILGRNFNDFHNALGCVVEFFKGLLFRDRIPLFRDVTVYLDACRNHLKNYVNHSRDRDNMYLVVIEIMRCILICIRLVDVGNKEDVQFLENTIKDINECLQRDYQPRNTYSLLTAAVIIWDNCRDDLDRTLSEDLIVFLLKCGASIDCRSRYGHTPLHILAQSEHTVASSMARLLLEKGAHLDFLDAKRQTPAQCARTDKMKALLESNPRPLKCLAAHVILEHNVSLDDLPNALKSFVAEHSAQSV